VASFTLRRASVYLYFSGLPIDLRVVVLEPDITEDHVLLSEARDSEERPFGVGFVAEDYVYNFGDLACLVGGTVHVVHQLSQMVTYLICDLRKEFFKRVQARFR